METLQMLATALGLATLAGLNLYLTVLVTGLAVRLGWVVLPSDLAPLEILADPWVIGVAAVLYVLEFFADKVPWIDSVNDAVHTAIRPVGGMLLAVLALGDAHPTVKVVAAILAGGAAFTAHAAKSGVRLAANASPEPVSNIVLSVGEDLFVLGALAFLAANPVLAGALLVLMVVGAWFVLPRIARGIRAVAWLAWRKLNAPAGGCEPAARKLPASCDLSLRRASGATAPFHDSARCLSLGGPSLPKNLFGWLVALDDKAAAIYFVAPRFLRGNLVLQIANPASSERSTGFLSEQLTIVPADGKPFRFGFDRPSKAAADRVAGWIGRPAADTSTPSGIPTAAGVS